MLLEDVLDRAAELVGAAVAAATAGKLGLARDLCLKSLTLTELAEGEASGEQALAVQLASDAINQVHLRYGIRMSVHGINIRFIILANKRNAKHEY
jgi:hypothetical protein